MPLKNKFYTRAIENLNYFIKLLKRGIYRSPLNIAPYPVATFKQPSPKKTDTFSVCITQKITLKKYISYEI